MLRSRLESNAFTDYAALANVPEMGAMLPKMGTNADTLSPGQIRHDRIQIAVTAGGVDPTPCQDLTRLARSAKMIAEKKGGGDG